MRILVLNIEVSGMNKYLFAQLRQAGHELIIWDVPLPKRLRYWALLISFVPHMRTWKKRFDYHLNKLYKSSWCFRWRTKQCEKIIKQYQGQYDLVINMTGMNAPVVDYTRFSELKYVVITSYNMFLAQKYDEWCTYEHEFKHWFDLEKSLYQNAQIIFTTNDNVRESLIKDYTVDSSRLLKMGYGLTFDGVEDYTKVYDGKTILFVGFDFKRKGGFTLLKAFEKVRQTKPDSRLVIIGPNKDMYKIEQEGVEFLGPVKDREKVKDYYKQASVFAMPSVCEPFGLVFLEAMAYKVPCVGSMVDAMNEIIEDGKTGYLIEPNDTDMLAEKILALLNDQKLNQKMGEQARISSMNMFSWEDVGQNLDTHIRKLL